MPPPLTLHVARDGKTIGQFPIDTAQQCLDGRIILPTDDCWHEGMTEWKPVSEVVVKQSLPPLPPPVDPPPLSNHPHPNTPNSSVGKKTSLAQKIAIGVGILCLSCCFTCSYFFDSSSTGGPQSSVSSNSESVPNVTRSPEPKKWFQNGTLHKATMAEWNMGSFENKRATAADFLASTIWEGHLNSPADFEKLKVKAEMLVKGMDIVGQSYTEESAVTVAAFYINNTSDLGPIN